VFESFIGVNFWTALAVLINFLIVFFVGKKFLFVPVKNMIDSRQQEIDAMYEQANDAKAQAQAMQKEYEQHLAGAKEEAAAMVRSAAKTAQSRGEQIILEAKEEAAAIRAKASDDIAKERKNAVNEIKNDISGIAVSIASKVVEKEISEKDHERLIQEFIDKMGEAV
jgi:F-type H+-transporting ATPase subunit b